MWDVKSPCFTVCHVHRVFSLPRGFWDLLKQFKIIARMLHAVVQLVIPASGKAEAGASQGLGCVQLSGIALHIYYAKTLC